MNGMLTMLTAYFVYNLPIAAALMWVKFTSLKTVKRTLLFYAKVHFATISFMFLYSLAIDWLCDGSALKGYVRCSIVPLPVANVTLTILIFALVGLAAFALVVVIFCATKEFRKSKANEH